MVAPRRRPFRGPAANQTTNADKQAKDAARLAFIQGEYNSIRAELVAAVSTQQTVMTYALAAMAVIFTGLLSVWSNLAVRIGILSLAPLILLFIWFVWFGEALRLIRARWFIWELEKKINTKLGSDPATANPATGSPATGNGLSPLTPGGSSLAPGDAVHWESWVRGHNRWGRNLHSRPAYHFVTGILCGTALASTVLALVFAFAAPNVPAGLRILRSVRARCSASCSGSVRWRRCGIRW